MSYWFWSNIPRYSIAELEEHKAVIKKVIEFRRGTTYSGLTGISRYSYPAFQTISDLEQQITEIDEEIDRRKHQPYLTSGVSILPNYVDYYGNANPFAKGIDTSQSSLHKELENERKEKNQLRKVIEHMSDDKREDIGYIKRLKRIIDHLCGNRGFTSNVSEE